MIGSSRLLTTRHSKAQESSLFYTIPHFLKGRRRKQDQALPLHFHYRNGITH